MCFLENLDQVQSKKILASILGILGILNFGNYVLSKGGASVSLGATLLITVSLKFDA